MDKIKQYQILSDIKPSYQKLVNPLYGVNRLKIVVNREELELHYKRLGLWDAGETKKEIVGGNDIGEVVFLGVDD